MARRGWLDMVVLVTGGSGFIGSHIVDKLIEHGYDVRVMDLREPHRDDVEWLKGDILNPHDCLAACRDADVVYHLAAIADVNVDLNPKTAAKYNITGVPTFILFKNGHEIYRAVAARSEEQLREILENALRGERP